MFGIGSTELLVILVVALIVLGPKSLASISRSLGKAMGEFRRVSTDFQRTLNAEVAQEEDEERRKKAAEKAAKTAAEAEAAKAARQERTASGEGTPTEEAAAPETSGTEAATARTETEAPSAATAAPAPDASETGPTIDVTPVPPEPPAGSPLAEALARTKAEAESGTAAPSADNSAPAPDNGGKV